MYVTDVYCDDVTRRQVAVWTDGDGDGLARASVPLRHGAGRQRAGQTVRQQVRHALLIDHPEVVIKAQQLQCYVSDSCVQVSAAAEQESRAAADAGRRAAGPRLSRRLRSAAVAHAESARRCATLRQRRRRLSTARRRHTGLPHRRQSAHTAGMYEYATGVFPHDGGMYEFAAVMYE